MRGREGVDGKERGRCGGGRGSKEEREGGVEEEGVERGDGRSGRGEGVRCPGKETLGDGVCKQKTASEELPVKVHL